MVTAQLVVAGLVLLGGIAPPVQASPAPTTPTEIAQAVLTEGDALRAAGKVDDALARYRQALATLAQELQVANPASGAVADPIPGYVGNRLASDLAALIRARIATVAAALPDARKSAALLEDAAACWPPTPEAKAVSLRLVAQGVRLALGVPGADRATVHLRVPGEREADEPSSRVSPPQISPQTLHYLISVFDATGEHTTPCITKLPENQPLVDRVSALSDEKLLTEAIGLVGAVDAALRGAAPLSKGRAAELARQWREAERRGVEGDPEGCARGLLTLSCNQAGSLLEPIGVLAAAQWLLQAGRYEGPAGAYQYFAEVARGAGPIRDHAELGLAELALCEGRYDDARPVFARLAAQCPDFRLRDWAALREARCLELADRWPEAVARYKALAASKCAEIADEATFGARRAGLSHRLPSSPGGAVTAVRYLGEDRATRGDWYTYYGSEAFVLCAQQAPGDVSGGTGLSVTPRTGIAQEKARRWVSTGTDLHPAMVYNPVARTRRPANWDDRGEAYPRGGGPDLWLDVAVPAGEHRLSLYFVNDHNYYEPSRVYTVSVYDEAGQWRAGAEVRWFVNGVYKQFGVSGPAKLRVCIARDLSMNVLLSGVFLDPLKVAVPASRGSDRRGVWAAWQAERNWHLSQADERATFRAVVRAVGDEHEALRFLDGFTATELAAHRYGSAMWAAEEKAQLLSDDHPALLRHLQSTIAAFSLPAPARAPHPTNVVMAWPFVEATFRDYLRQGAEGLSRDQLAAFYRATATAYERQFPSFAGMAYERLVAAVGEKALTPDEQFRITFTATDKTADTARLERALAGTGELPNRAQLEMLLLGRYLAGQQVDKAQVLVDRMKRRGPKADTTANAVYNLGLCHFRAKRYDAARTCFEGLKKDFPTSHWTILAEGYAKRMTDATPAAPIPPGE